MHFLNIFHVSCRSHPYTLFTKSMIFHISYYFVTIQPCAEKDKNSAQAGLQRGFVFLRHRALSQIEDLAAYAAVSSVSCAIRDAWLNSYYYFYLLQDEPCIFRLHMIALIQRSKSHVFSSAQTGITMNSKEVPHVRNSFKTYV